ncbi:MAG TPA: hypothetical protein VG675_09485 [Bryobacteraceae bacterium]|nr:hypothetical protein [Bryobacteraceae bacterium]
MMLLVADILQVRCCGRGPANARHLGTQHLLETRGHFFFNELATVSLRNTFAHGSTEAGFFLKQAQGSVFHQVFGVGS